MFRGVRHRARVLQLVIAHEADREREDPGWGLDGEVYGSLGADAVCGASVLCLSGWEREGRYRRGWV